MGSHSRAFSVRQYGPHCNNCKIDNYALFFVLSAPKCCPLRARLANRLHSIRVGQWTMMMLEYARKAAAHLNFLSFCSLRVEFAKLLNLNASATKCSKRCAPNAPQLATIAMIDWPIMRMADSSFFLLSVCAFISCLSPDYSLLQVSLP